MKSKNSSSVFDIIRSYGIITIGLFINALSWTAFLIPSEIVGGGVTGAASLLYFATEFPVAVTFLVVNIILLSFGIKSLGLGFGIKTVYGIVVLSGFLAMLQPLFPEPVVDDRFMAAIIGGILGGAAIGMVFTQGGSTGGTDIIAMIINKYRNISHGRLILLMDVVIISSSYILFQSFEVLVYGFVTMAVGSYSIDMLLMGHKRSVQLFIFSKHNEIIADRVVNEIGRGVTLLQGKGWYTKEDVAMLMVVVKRYESGAVFRVVKEVDPKAFITMGSVMGVYGQGFEPIRS
ncbi:MAG TPA: YitT family protein [Bacteroidales bacterium]|nr:YitT family protein [Bacteroidales bacterium]